MTPPTSRTQLEEAIKDALIAHERDYTKYTGESAIDKRKTSTATILSAVDAHVKRVIGEDEIKLSKDGVTDDTPALQALIDAPISVRTRLSLRREQRLRAGLEENHGA